jgi:hypothetical protein
MSDVEHPQTDGPLERGAPIGFQVPIEMVRALKSPGQALDLAIRAAGKERKEVYLELSIDAGTFSKVLDDKASFPDEKLTQLCRYLGNRIFAEWQAWQVGCMLVVVRDVVHEELDEAHRRLAERDAEISYLRRALREGAPA